ncbi:MAG: HlyD family efflux transporter periplasmic adaptor subunit [Lewinellaceae bacterium]|nr:HlyD family efflux transporter periplasmic adaptor subunit [Saprospiraceae bacterium]MCB9341628.1 HlyD family efflux transporter periplasmic adaptor subunit [Lewinellaceae bacterium]
MKTNILTHLHLLLAVLASILLLQACGLSENKSNEQAKQLSTIIQKGEFKIYVAATGELKAKNSEEIKGPTGMRSAQIWQATISDMVPEGTVVKAGAYVASLDPTELQTKLKEAQTEIDKIQTQLEQAKIDTAIELRGIRDDLVNLKFGMEEKKLQVEQSKYEPKMVIQQAEIDLQKSKRDYTQLEKKYELTQTKSVAKISEILASLRQQELKRQRLQELSEQFVVKAPKDGMVIYARSWNGKVGPGSQISTWDPVVAELPDLSIMISKTYVNEVDISKVQKGQNVAIKVDAFPDREYSGQVIQVANVGEQLRGYDSKVFEVTVQINEVDSILRPAMTTSNEILTYTYQDVLHIPLEALLNDTIAYVYKKENGKVVKQEVLTGETNDNEVIIAHGLAENAEVMLTVPDNPEKLPFVPIDPKIKEEIKKKLAEEKKKRQEEAAEKLKQVKDEYQPKDGGGGGGFIIFG